MNNQKPQKDTFYTRQPYLHGAVFLPTGVHTWAPMHSTGAHICAPVHYTGAHECALVHYTGTLSGVHVHSTGAHMCAPVQSTGPAHLHAYSTDRRAHRVHP
jgi:hypothetical protein